MPIELRTNTYLYGRLSTRRKLCALWGFCGAHRRTGAMTCSANFACEVFCGVRIAPVQHP